MEGNKVEPCLYWVGVPCFYRRIEYYFCKSYICKGPEAIWDGAYRRYERGLVRGKLGSWQGGLRGGYHFKGGNVKGMGGSLKGCIRGGWRDKVGSFNWDGDGYIWEGFEGDCIKSGGIIPYYTHV